ncbi:MAG: AAA family ATPase, partial [Anaerotignum sp.]|nr:AAA family ATPase [Anaerotignum sp.]
LLVNASAKNMPLRTEDLLFNPRSSSYKETGLNMLHDMIGLENIKNELNRMLATVNLDNRRRMEGIEIPPAWRNMAFSGSPGTGKSVTARLVAQILREEGCGSGRFVEAGREQLIGAFLGQTSPMIAKLFQQAKGGVLFIDEAGALLNNGNDIYATEAVNALVRHMELEPETIVIFATYPDEMQQLLDSNPGLSSRIAHVLEFCSYDEDQLFHIFCAFAKKERLPVANGIKPICDDFFRSLKNKKAENFGNGREARRLYLTAKEELALRAKNRPNTALKLTKKDLQLAATRLLLQENEKQNYIGFAAN